MYGRARLLIKDVALKSRECRRTCEVGCTVLCKMAEGLRVPGNKARAGHIRLHGMR